ncbi:hypothetical protein FHS95_003419 [Sphingomonas naasensis]|uniref:CBM-cenC domain-containing protein n=1 Tax=Sphingomonas naasensis TaxID=1344951 RepID=A0A4S1WEK1_9SPHN|nr:carbohydrate binding domain-containing protein [Sphingomonas naasensis]NIJ21716.1 hypothetical protein [Sphingomonas naasensis]TGX41359.1 hypothetical protein E5A74_12005 [Sphingomonas naasensis]
MNLRIALALGAAMPALFAVPGVAQQAQSSDDALAEKVINNTNPASFQVYGLTPAPKTVSDKAVQGGKALRIPVTGSGNPWSIGVNVPLTRPVKAGDKIVVAFYARLSKAEATSAKLNAQLQLSAAPYTAIFAKSFDATPEWQFLQFAGKADRDYAVGALTAAFHVNTGNHVLDLGPVAVFDMGQ